MQYGARPWSWDNGQTPGQVVPGGEGGNTAQKLGWKQSTPRWTGGRRVEVEVEVEVENGKGANEASSERESASTRWPRSRKRKTGERRRERGREDAREGESEAWRGRENGDGRKFGAWITVHGKRKQGEGVQWVRSKVCWCGLCPNGRNEGLDGEGALGEGQTEGGQLGQARANGHKKGRAFTGKERVPYWQPVTLVEDNQNGGFSSDTKTLQV